MKSINQETRARYDDLPYTSYAYKHCAPETMAAVAAVFGLSSPEVPRSRVLELGAASGGNLVPIALRHPKAEVVGVDISGVQVAAGREYIARLAVGNATLLEADILELDPEALGKFDYIIVHGVYSWVPAEVQDAILRLIRHCLTPDGVAFISYNTYPGWKAKEIVREAMQMHGGSRPTPAEQVAYGRAMLNFLQRVALKGGLTAAALNESLPQVMGLPTSYVAHEYLAPYNQPCYFHQFVERIRGHELAYMGESQISMMLPSNYGPELAQQLYGALGQDQVRVEQYLDFAINRAFRQTLVMHAERANALHWKLDQDSLRGMHFAARLSAADGAPITLDGRTQDFVAPPNGASISTGVSAIKQAIARLSQSWPGTVTRDELVDHARRTQGSQDALSEETLADAIDELIEKLVLRGMASFRLEPVETTASAEDCPVVDPAVRRQVSALGPSEDHVANVWHDSYQIAEVERLLFPAMDGTLGRNELITLVAEALRRGQLPLDAASGIDLAVQAASLVAQMYERLPESAVLRR